jgi:hypothetical protein
MATTIKKTNTKAKTSTKKVDNEVDEVIEDTVEETVEEKRKFKADDAIPCHSVIEGGVYFEGAKTNMFYSFTGYGDVVDIEYADLAAAVRTKSPFLFNPWFIVDDEDFVEEFPMLKKFYSQNYTTKELKNILKLPVDEMTEAIKALPKSAVDSLKTIAATRVADGRIDSVTKIKALDELFGTELGLLQSILA